MGTAAQSVPADHPVHYERHRPEQPSPGYTGDNGPSQIKHPFGSGARRRRRPKCGFHHVVGNPAKEKGISPVEVLRGMLMQFFVRGNRTMIATSIQRNVYCISKGSH